MEVKEQLNSSTENYKLYSDYKSSDSDQWIHTLNCDPQSLVDTQPTM